MTSVPMILYPALDLRAGKVVRLKQGDPSQQTIFDLDPRAAAERWIAAGAEWLHVVNLDGAFSNENANEAIVRDLATLGIPVQFGGGMRRREDITRAFDLGVKRVILGTLAVEQPEIVAACVTEYGTDAVAVGLDARDGHVTTRGWLTVTARTPISLGKQMAALGARHALYTDVNRDGQMIGVNVDATAELARETGLAVIASGGVSSIEDIVALRDAGVIAGAVLGTALYTGRLDFAAALYMAKGE